MRVAVIGANLLGSSSAFYIRKALEANRTGPSIAGSEEQSTTGLTSTEVGTDASDPDSTHEIVVFDRLSRPGGFKYQTLQLEDVSVPAGTAADMDVAASPALVSLMNDAGIDPPLRKSMRDWSIFDWEKDDYNIGQVHSALCAIVRESLFLSALLQIFALLSAAHFFQLFQGNGFLLSFVALKRRRRHFLWLRFFWFLVTLFFAGGVVPIGWLMRLYDSVFFRSWVQVIGGMTYGGHSTSALATVVKHIQHHIQVILERDAASSCVTLGHLLSACGTGKYAKVSVTEFFAKFHIQQSLLDDCVSPGLAQTYGNSACTAGPHTNALAGLFNALVRSPIPTSFRAKATYFDSEQTNALCPQVLKAAGAELRLGIDVRSVQKSGEAQYELSGTDANERHKLVSLGKFDAVALAAIIDPEVFKTDATDYALDQVLALDPALSGLLAGDVRVLNVARYISLIKGEVKPQFFNKSRASSIASHVTVLKSPNCSDVKRVADGVYRVASWEKPEHGSSLLSTVFQGATDIVSIERRPRRYHPAPIRNLDGVGAPSFILGTRFMNAACVDRIANDPNLDILSARNTASFFRDGVANWK